MNQNFKRHNKIPNHLLLSVFILLDFSLLMLCISYVSHFHDKMFGRKTEREGWFVSHGKMFAQSWQEILHFLAGAWANSCSYLCESKPRQFGLSGGKYNLNDYSTVTFFSCLSTMSQCCNSPHPNSMIHWYLISQMDEKMDTYLSTSSGLQERAYVFQFKIGLVWKIKGFHSVSV